MILPISNQESLSHQRFIQYQTYQALPRVYLYPHIYFVYIFISSQYLCLAFLQFVNPFSCILFIIYLHELCEPYFYLSEYVGKPYGVRYFFYKKDKNGILLSFLIFMNYTIHDSHLNEICQ